MNTPVIAQSQRGRLAILMTLLLLGVSAAVSVPASPAAAATARNGQCQRFRTPDNSSYWFNYDFLEETADCGAVDWATSLLFWGTADIDFVKSTLGDLGYEDSSFEIMHMPVQSYDTSEVWDGDGGKKEIACPAVGLSARHYRIYAPPERDYMWANGFGFFVVGTTHIDANECPPIGKRHYGSEETERHIAQVASNAGYPTAVDWSNFLNEEPYRVEGSHTWENSGRATYINM
ncbi:hypothetical protein ACTMTJ_44875 [Phytohabitans sp. LJ34]|uniref:hypothetical protein n=1 Tax=Phytohabitans sp. LJ34 TaxID=3452217 RepID=UPI003F8B23F0